MFIQSETNIAGKFKRAFKINIIKTEITANFVLHYTTDDVLNIHQFILGPGHFKLSLNVILIVVKITLLRKKNRCSGVFDFLTYFYKKTSVLLLFLTSRFPW